jgi:hypothetical protein
MVNVAPMTMTLIVVCVGAGYIPPLLIEAPLISQGRHICRPYSTLTLLS